MAAAAALAQVAVGFATGILSGMFGIGGGIATTPAIRLLLGFPALVAVGTPLLVVLPTTLTGAWSYRRNGLADLRVGVTVGLWGAPAAAVGAAATRFVGGTVVLLLTAALIAWVAGDMLWHAFRTRGGAGGRAVFEGEEPVLVDLDAAPDESSDAATPGPIATDRAPGEPARRRWWQWAFLGLATGVYSGFLGLGGGFVLVPLLERRAGMPIKRAIGTSLVAISILAIPGIATHWYLGHIVPTLAFWLAVGSVPGALLGARITRGASDRWVRVGFAVMLLAVGAWLAVAEIATLVR